MKQYLLIPYNLSYTDFFKDIKFEIVDYKNINSIKSDSRKKIVVVDYFYYENNKVDFYWADLVICFSIDPLWFRQIYNNPEKELGSLFSDFKNENSIIIYSGKYKDHEPFPNKIYPYWIYWINCLVKFNDPVDYSFTKPRPYLFDALMGKKKLHRIKLFEKLKEHNLLNKSLVSIKDIEYIESDFPNYESPSLLDLENDYIKKFKQENVLTINYGNMLSHNNNLHACCSISPKIYENSWFSLVTEGIFHRPNNYNYDLIHISEKTGKCFFSKRIFVYFGAPTTLQILKEIHGFKTFDGIIDESYDLEVDPDKRFDMAWSQVEWLSKQDPIKLYEQAMPILEHNFNQMINTELGYDKIKDFIKFHVEKL